jgi:hypothetical protein
MPKIKITLDIQHCTQCPFCKEIERFVGDWKAEKEIIWLCDRGKFSVDKYSPIPKHCPCLVKSKTKKKSP